MNTQNANTGQNDPAHRQPPIGGETAQAEQAPAVADASGCLVQRNCSALDNAESVENKGLKKLRFIKEWELAGKPKIFFAPQKDITAWELAQLNLLILPSSSSSLVYSLEESCFRHLMLPSSKPTGDQNQSKSKTGQYWKNWIKKFFNAAQNK